MAFGDLIGSAGWQNNALADYQKQAMQQTLASAYSLSGHTGYAGLANAAYPQHTASAGAKRLNELFASVQQKVANKAAEHFSAVAATRLDPDSNMAWLDRRVNEMRVAL